MSLQLRSPEVKSRKGSSKTGLLDLWGPNSTGEVPYLQPQPKAWVYGGQPEAPLSITWGTPNPASSCTHTLLHDSAAVLTFL